MGICYLWFSSTIEFNYPQNDSIRYSINVSGVDTLLLIPLRPILNSNVKFKETNELFNALGKEGWEIYLIEDFPNTIQQATDHYSGRPIQGAYNLYRNSQYSKRKVYLKMKF